MVGPLQHKWFMSPMLAKAQPPYRVHQEAGSNPPTNATPHSGTSEDPMDTNFATQLTLSILFFAPGVALLAGLAFVGLLMLLEKTVLGRGDSALAQGPTLDAELPIANPAPGRIVAGLKAAVAQEMQPQRAVGDRK